MTLVPNEIGASQLLSQDEKDGNSQIWIAEHIDGEIWKLRNEGGFYVTYPSSKVEPGIQLIGVPDGHGYEFLISQSGTQGGAEFRIWFPNAPLPGYVVEVGPNSRIQSGEKIGTNATQFWLFQALPINSQ